MLPTSCTRHVLRTGNLCRVCRYSTRTNATLSWHCLVHTHSSHESATTNRLGGWYLVLPNHLVEYRQRQWMTTQKRLELLLTKKTLVLEPNLQVTADSLLQHFSYLYTAFSCSDHISSVMLKVVPIIFCTMTAETVNQSDHVFEHFWSSFDRNDVVDIG